MLLLLSLAHANGLTSHVTISEWAAGQLPAGELADILGDPNLWPYLQNGTQFPDGGYPLGEAYSETAHWEPFQDRYLAWIADTYAGDFTSTEARQHVAFLFGMQSHGMGDQVFDSLYMQRAYQFDAESDWGATSMDEATDVALSAATGGQQTLDPGDAEAELGAHRIVEEVLVVGKIVLQRIHPEAGGHHQEGHFEVAERERPAIGGVEQRADGRAKVEAKRGREAVTTLLLEDTEHTLPGEALGRVVHRRGVEDSPPGAEEGDERAHRCARNERGLQIGTVERLPSPRVSIASAAASPASHDERAFANLRVEAGSIQLAGLEHPPAPITGLFHQLGEVLGGAHQAAVFARQPRGKGVSNPPGVRRQGFRNVHIYACGAPHHLQLRKRQHVPERVEASGVQLAGPGEEPPDYGSLHLLEGQAVLVKALDVHWPGVVTDVAALARSSFRQAA